MPDMEENKIKKARYQLQSFLEDCPIKHPQNLRLLEVGFKEGVFLQVCREAGINAAGLEVEPGYYNRLRLKEADLELILYDGKTIPLPDASFDAIVSFQVLEHVGSLETTLAECIRLLKTGGIMYHVFPNYHSFYEGHYRVLWWPFLNRTSGRWYLKLLRKYTPYYESLNIVKPGTITRIMTVHRDTIEVISLGKKEFKNHFCSEQIAKVEQSFLRRILTSIHKTPFLRQILLRFMSLCNLYYPITLIARKK
jgi:ubiquinone/menaquinone biosynthesis C-methylase UbiE